LSSEPVYASDTTERVVALTFDDGPSPWTLPILDTLAEHRVHAKFFVVGDSIAGHEEILRRTRDEGHEIGNHTATHPRALDADELRRAATAIEDVLGDPPALFRPPYFAYDDNVLRAGAECGYRHAVYANVYTNDWEATDGAVVAAEILAKVVPGCFICMHDGCPPHESCDRAPTAEAVRILVPELLARGYRFARVSDLLGT
jgi:peptidoglycan/xylan/chitin deacetylase (PgdA/CDA1 family)